jgi:hypothetical protein
MNIALAISAQQVNYDVSGIGTTHLKLNGKVLGSLNPTTGAELT